MTGSYRLDKNPTSEILLSQGDNCPFASEVASDGSGELEEIIDKYLTSLVDPKISFDLQASERLYRRLISPIENELQGKHHLIIIPEGPLLNIPFAALRKPGPTAQLSSSDWLIDTYSLTTGLSIKSFLALRQIGIVPGNEASLVAFADPTIHDDKGLCASYSGWIRRPQKSQGLCPLPEALDQAFALAEIAGVDPKQNVISGAPSRLKAWNKNSAGE
jgi:CHAT domain-containing protein